MNKNHIHLIKKNETTPDGNLRKRKISERYLKVKKTSCGRQSSTHLSVKCYCITSLKLFRVIYTRNYALTLGSFSICSTLYT